MEAIIGRKTLQESAAYHSIHPVQVSQWKKQLLEGSSELLTRRMKSQSKDEGQAKEAELFLQIGKLQMELEWLKKISAALTPMNDESWSIQTTGSSRLAANVSCLDWPDPPTTTSQFLSVIPRWRSWPGLMPSTWRIPPVVAAELFTIWREMAFRSAATECVTSCAAWVYGRSTRNQGRPFQAALLSAFPVWWTSTRSPTSLCTKDSCIWLRSWTCTPGMFSAVSFPIAWTPSSAWRRWRCTWRAAADQKSFIPIRVVNSPQPTMWRSCR